MGEIAASRQDWAAVGESLARYSWEFASSKAVRFSRKIGVGLGRGPRGRGVDVRIDCKSADGTRERSILIAGKKLGPHARATRSGDSCKVSDA